MATAYLYLLSARLHAPPMDFVLCALYSVGNAPLGTFWSANLRFPAVFCFPPRFYLIVILPLEKTVLAPLDFGAVLVPIVPVQERYKLRLAVFYNGVIIDVVKVKML